MAPIWERLRGRRPPRFPNFFFIGLIDSMFNICICISSFRIVATGQRRIWGGIGPKKFFFYIVKNWKTWFGPPLCEH